MPCVHEVKSIVPCVHEVKSIVPCVHEVEVQRGRAKFCKGYRSHNNILEISAVSFTS